MEMFIKSILEKIYYFIMKLNCFTTNMQKYATYKVYLG